MEAHTYKRNVLSGYSLSLMGYALPLMAQPLQKSSHDLQSYLDLKKETVFNSIQPSVEWGYEEVVWSFVKNIGPEKSVVSIPVVSFQNLYLLYGAIDMKSSTVERCKAWASDLSFQLHAAKNGTACCP